MNTFGALLTVAIIVGGFLFAYWAIKKTLSDDKGKNRRQRRAGKR